jgi:hypothetical protein
LVCNTCECRLDLQLTVLLARKHTGERPFECHCKRTFSRLDNLRQHAQTVHLNEDIPPDSLAASGTRYQKSLGRPSLRHGPRARTSTGSSAGRPIRGHSKSLSTSSIASIGTVHGGPDPRRRPPPLVMADPQARLSYESYRPEGQGPLPGSPSDFSTPTSATFSTGQNSPRYGIASPSFSHAQSYHARRLSVPSGGNMYMHGANSPQYLLPPAGMVNSNSGPFSPTNSSIISSPTASTASGWSRRESVGSRAADDAYRRRTWHPDTLQFHRESRLSQVITPSQLGPPAPLVAARPGNPDQPQQQTTLPSVQSLLRMVDSEPANNRALPVETGMVGDGRRNSGLPAEWDRSLHRRINDLDINNSPRDGAGTWANETNQAVLAQAEQARVIQGPPAVRFNPEIENGYGSPSSRGPPARHYHTMSAPVNNLTPGDTRRQAWHNGPVASRQPPETIHEGRPHVDRIEHPNLSQFSGFPARNNPPVVHQQTPEPAMDRRPAADNMDNRRLDVLVAAASSIETATATATATPIAYRAGNMGRQDEMMVEAREEERAPPPRIDPALGHFSQPYPRCRNCGRTDTPEWRQGPDGPGTLCNSCGLEYFKLETRRQTDRRFEARRFEQYVGRV